MKTYNIILSHEHVEILQDALLNKPGLSGEGDLLLGMLLDLPAEDSDVRDACHDFTL